MDLSALEPEKEFRPESPRTKKEKKDPVFSELELVDLNTCLTNYLSGYRKAASNPKHIKTFEEYNRMVKLKEKMKQLIL